MLRNSVAGVLLVLSLGGCCMFPKASLCPVCPGSPGHPDPTNVWTNPMRPIVWRITRDSGHGPETIAVALDSAQGAPWDVCHLPGALPFRATDIIDPTPLATGYMAGPSGLCAILIGQTKGVQNTLVVAPDFDLNNVVWTSTCP